ncbi:MAG TPA: glutamate-cysteine ligase family protein [Noviherbaspirillum sp.]|nr:glutamate-cysteine ligase family protein [Noviherbaspirillum sp.]
MNTDDDPPQLHAFAGYGIELEYMIVDRATLSVKPLADRLLRDDSGQIIHELKRGLLGWSNELVLHVVEIKNLRPVIMLSLLQEAFQSEVREINERLDSLGACLMPGAMHPWMNPATDARLWPHQNEEIYRAYAHIFDTRSHGWVNLQSMHINLPFSGDAEFARLHAAIRLVLPILPALAASSPVADGRPAGFADYRMRVYCDNAREIPSVAGLVIPETITSRAAYEQRLLAPMYRDIERHDPQGVLQYEWLNSRGAIARFDRSAIEIRVVDTQECPHADLAVAAATIAVVRLLYRAAEANLVEQQEIPTNALAAILQDCIRDAEQAVIGHAGYLRLLGVPEPRCTAGELWAHLVGQIALDDPVHESLWHAPLQVMLRQGPLARRILRALGPQCTRARMEAVYRELCACLQEGRMFLDRE